MKIWIDESFILKPKTGIGMYALTLEEALKQLQINYETFEFSLPKSLKFKFVFHILWLNTIFYIKTLIQKPDIIIFPNYLMPFLKRHKTIYIPVIHDICVKKDPNMNSNSRLVYNIALNIAQKRADKIITVSETVKQELIETYSIKSEKIFVVYNSLGKHFFKNTGNNEILEKLNIKSNKYILSVVSLEKRKNLPELIKAFSMISEKYPDIKLVLVGKLGNENKADLMTNNNVIITGYLNDEDIPILYKNALMYTFVSLYEGFGIPIIEAQYSKTPLICSDISIFREIAGNGAEFCIPTAEYIAKTLNKLLSEEKKLQELANNGTENVKKYYIEKIAEQLRSCL